MNCVNSLYFNSLNVDQISSIIRLQLQSAEESFKEEDIQITFTDNAIQSILKQSYNPGKQRINLNKKERQIFWSSHAIQRFVYFDRFWCSSSEKSCSPVHNNRIIEIIDSNEYSIALSANNRCGGEWYLCILCAIIRNYK